MEITRQEAWVQRDGDRVEILPFIAELIERAAFLAREDKRSGGSQRMPITVLETAVSNAERRAISNGEEVIVPRVADVYAALPAITGKMELEYEGELQGSETIARDLVATAARDLFDRYWEVDDLEEVIDHFDRGGVLQISDSAATDVCWKGLSTVPGLVEALEGSELYQEGDVAGNVAAAELLLEGLAGHRKISRADTGTYARARPERRPGKGGGSFGMDFS